MEAATGKLEWEQGVPKKSLLSESRYTAASSINERFR